MKSNPVPTKFHNLSVVAPLKFSAFKVFTVMFLLPTSLLCPPANGQVKRPRAEASKASPCSFELNGSPEIKGLKLGMTPAEFLKIFPSARETSASFETEVGERSFLVNSNENSSFAGVNVTAVKFVDGGLSFLSLTYMNLEPGGSGGVAALVKQTVANLKLPTEVSWQSGGKAIKILNCLDFSVTVSSGDFGFRQELPYLLLEDKGASEKVAARRKAIAERRTPTAEKEKIKAIKRPKQ